MYIKKFKNRIISCSVLLSMIFSNISLASMKLIYDGTEHEYLDDPISLVINGKNVKSEVPPIIIDSRTLVPARAVFEQLGATVSWVAETQNIFVSFEESLILLTINSNEANVNGEIKQIEVPPKIINNSTMIPLRFVAEALNFDIAWNGNEKIASINSKKEDETTQAQTQESIVETTTQQTTAETTTQQTTTETTTQQTTVETTTQQTTAETTTQQTTVETTTQQTTVKPTIQTTTQQSTSKTTQKPNQSSDGIITIEGNSTNIDNRKYPPIVNENHDVVDLTSITLPENGSEIFTINATDKISSISYDLIKDPDRFYIDIQNSVSSLYESIDVTTSKAVKSIRTAQQQNLNNVTRVVFDLVGSYSYDIYMSEDRKSLNVRFKPTLIEKITYENTNGQDIINIYSNSSVESKIMYLSDPDRFVIDIAGAISSMGSTSVDLNSEFASALRTSQFNENDTRIVLDTKKLFDYEVVENDSLITIKLINPTYKNLEYKNSKDAPKIILKKDANNPIDIKSIIHEDKYLDNTYKITLKGDYSNLYGHGEYKMNDGYLNSVTIRNDNGNTQFVFNEKNVYVCTITEDEQNIYLNIYNPKTVYKQVVVIDPGHGGDAPGAIHNGLTEKDVTLDVGNRLYLLLENDKDIKVYATRVTDENPSFNYRVNLPNHVADMFVSIHCNSISSSSVSGVQVFYPNPSDERGNRSKQLASLLMDGVTSNTGLPNRPANQSIGYQLYVLRNTKVPACLVEMGFLTNQTDVAKLATPEGRQQVAQGIYEGIKKGFQSVIPSR